MKANKAKNSITWKSGKLKQSLSSKGTGVNISCKYCIRDSRIRSYTSLYAIALALRQEGEEDFFSFLGRNTGKSV